MSRWESNNVLSGVAFIRAPHREPTFRPDHTVIDAGHHRLIWSDQRSVGERPLSTGVSLGSPRPANGR
jgi:hypothetical protein